MITVLLVIHIMIAASLVGIVLLAGVLLVRERTNMLEDHKAATRFAVESAWGVLDAFEKRAASGELTQDEARRQAVRRELARAEGAGEQAAVVGVRLDLDAEGARQQRGSRKGWCSTSRPTGSSACSRPLRACRSARRWSACRSRSARGSATARSARRTARTARSCAPGRARRAASAQLSLTAYVCACLARAIAEAKPGKYVVVQVSDSGTGIPPEVLDRIFDPFFTTKPFGEGTGLGLDLAWRIVVEKHSGDLRVQSEPGDTRFIVLLPDTSLRDTENVPLKESIAAYFEREVRPHVPDAWVEEEKTKIGYEIPFTRHFYEYVAPRGLGEIEKEIRGLEEEIRGMLEGVLS